MQEPPPNRKARRAAEAAGEMTEAKFLKIADRFIDMANRENRDVKATDLHLAFLYAAARYNAHVARRVIDVPEDEPFVEDMVRKYQDMLRNHLADPKL